MVGNMGIMNKNALKTANGSDRPLVLAVETSGRLGSVALGGGGEVFGEKKFSAPMKHSKEIFTAVQELLEEFNAAAVDIKQIHISVGPGSFTGLRIAVAMAKMMSLANETKIVAVDTLDVIAENAAEYLRGQNSDAQRVGVILDAKRGQFFTAVYEYGDGVVEKVGADRLMTAEEFVKEFAAGGKSISLIGEGLVYYKDKFAGEGVEVLEEELWWPTAKKVYELGCKKAARGEFSDAIAIEPTYMQRGIWPHSGSHRLINS